MNFKGYVDSLKKTIINDKIHPNLRTLGLIIFKDNDYDKDVEFLTPKKEIIKVNPSAIIAPFSSTSFVNTRKAIDDLTRKNVSLHQTASQILNCLVMDVYPNDIDFADSVKLARAIILLAKEAMKDKNLQEDDDVILLKNKIEEISKLIPDLII